MSLLDHEDDPFDLEPVELGRSNTGSPLMEAEGGESFSLHRPKEKKDRKARLAEDKKGSSLSLRKPRQSKEPASDKTPKRGKHVRSKSGSRTPPDSPKAAKAAEAKRQARAGSVQLHPSPNVKSNRKRYSQLGKGQSSTESDLEDDSGLFVSNRATTEEHESSPTPQQSIEQKTAISATNTAQPCSPPRSPTHHPDFTFPTSIMQQRAIPNLGMLNVRRSTVPMTEPATSPERPVRMSIQDPQSATVQELHSPGQLPLFTTMQFFQTPQPPHLHPFSVPSQSTTLPPATVEDEWAISEELQQKCKRQFLDLHPESGLLHGDKARNFFLQSKLPNQELSQIWRLADVDGDNALSEQEFCTAMKLVLMRRKGHSIPAALPEGVRQKPGDGVFSDSFVPQQQPQAAPPPPVKSTQSVADLAPPPPREPSTTTKPKLAHVVQKSAPNLLGPDPGITEQPAVSPDTSQEEGRMEEGREGHSTEPVMEEHNTSDTGLLVTAQSLENTEASAESRKAEGRKAAVPASNAQEPAIGRIISIDADSEEEGEEDESTAFFQRRKRTSSEGTVQKDLPQEQGSSKQLIVGPVRRSKSLRHTPSHPDPLVDSHRVYPEDGDPSPKGESETTPIITLDLPLPKPAPRKGLRSAAVGVDKSRYTSLGSPSTSPTGPAHEDREEGSDSSESPVLALKERGHARSTSLDLKKMLKEGGGQAHTGLPSAVPPKPPPKPAPARGTATAQEDDKPVARARSASTGSISSTGVASSLDRSEEHVLDVSAEALLLAPRPPPTRPKPQRKAPLVPPNYKPKRPPPPRPKPAAVESQPMQPVQEDTLPSLRDKAALQSTIRSLQETNATLRAINQGLEEKLFKIMEDRVQLGRELELAKEASH